MADIAALELAPARPFGIGEVLSDTFGLMRDRLLVVLAIALLVSLPTRLCLIVLPVLGEQLNLGSQIAAAAFGAASTGLIAALAISFGEGALIQIALARDEGRKIGLLQSLLPAVRRAPTLFVVTLLTTFGVLLGFVCLVVPGVMLSLMWWVVGPVAAVEGTGVIETFRRSRALTDDRLGEIFGLMLVSGIGGSAFAWVTRHLAESLLGVGANGLVYPFSPIPFLVGTLLDATRSAFDIALVCSLYVALIRVEGGGPMRQHLKRVFE